MAQRATSRSMLAATAATALVMVGVWLAWISPYMRAREEAHPHRALHVRVVEEGHPERGVSGAWVLAFPLAPGRGPSRFETPTPTAGEEVDAGGRATLDRVARTGAYLQVYAAGFVMATRMAPHADGNTAEVVVPLSRGLEVAGRVLKADGTPAAGAVVRGGQHAQGYPVTTDHVGAFRSSGFTSGLVSLHATWGDDAAVWEGAATVDGGARDVEVHLHAEPTRRRIRLLLKGEDEQPVASAHLEAKDAGLADSYERDSVGQVVKGEAILPASLRVRWLSIDTPRDELGVDLPWAPLLIGPLGARGGDLEVVMTGGHALTGTVRDEAGKPLEGVSVNATPLAVEGGREQSVYEGWWGEITDAEGRFTIEGVSPGRVELDARMSEGTNWPKAHVTVPSAPVDLVVRRRRVLKGSLRHEDGSAAPEGVLYRQGTSEVPDLAGWTKVSTEPDGTFEIWTYGRATVRLRAGLPPTGPEEMTASELTPDAAAAGVVLTVPRGTDIVVRIPDWPVEEVGAARVLKGADSGGVARWILGNVARFDDVDARAPLAFYCGPTVDGRIGFLSDILAAGPQPTVPLIVGRTVRGHARGFPRDASPVGVWADSGQFESKGQLTTDGTFRVVGIPPGAYRVCVVFRRGDESWCGSVASSGDVAPLVIDLERINQGEFAAWLLPRR